jgi:hypothetical protein
MQDILSKDDLEFDLIKTLQMKAMLPLMYLFITYKNKEDVTGAELYIKCDKYQTSKYKLVPFYKQIT